jgi:glycosyltransferase involved in cell wall biosynthesis
MIRDLFGPYTALTKHPCTVILPDDGPEFLAGSTTQVVRSPWKHGQNLRRMWFQSFQMGRKYCKNAILLTTDSKTPFFLPRNCKLIPLVTDLAVYRMPEAYQASRVWWWRFQYRYIRKRADLFLTISEFTKRDMMELFHIPAEKIRVIPCACSPELARVRDADKLEVVRRKYNLPEHFLLFVGNSNPRKNLARMMRAFDQAKGAENISHQLVIAGEQGWKFSREQALREIEHKDEIRFIGFVPDEDMAALYSLADLFVFPTLYEGFGIPVIEAQTCGTPVLTSNCTALPEVGGEGAIYVDPYDTADICRGILEVIQNAELARKLTEKGYQNAKRFSWRISAERLNEVVEEIVR